jgi:hypothetical protein
VTGPTFAHGVAPDLDSFARGMKGDIFTCPGEVEFVFDDNGDPVLDPQGFPERIIHPCKVKEVEPGVFEEDPEGEPFRSSTLAAKCPIHKASVS